MADIKDPENTIIMQTSKGKVVIELMPNVAPKHCEQMKTLARKEAYDNVIFHRVIEDFMAQTGDVEYGKADGDPRMAGRGGSDLDNVPAEFSKVPHARGSLGAARSQSPDSANSQFFINFKDNDFLNGNYTVYGQVIEGMDVIDSINKTEPVAADSLDKIETLRVAADVTE